MDNFAYLNQISKSARAKSVPAPKSKNPLAKFSIGKIALIGVVCFFLLMALGGLLGSINGKPKELSKQLYVRTTNLSTTLTTYNPSVKSSRLRSISVSLIAILNHTSSQLSSYISGDEKHKEEDLLPKTKVLDSETAMSEELNLSLNRAKLNGILDRTYENQLTLQVSLLLSLTSQLLARTKDETLISILTPFYSSLETIHNNLESYTNLGN